MKTVTLSRFNEVIKKAHPNAAIETRDGKEVVVIPTYNPSNDTAGEDVLLLERDEASEGGRIRIGDLLHHSKTGSPFNIVDPIAKMLKIRKGPKSD